LSPCRGNVRPESGRSAPEGNASRRQRDVQGSLRVGGHALQELCAACGRKIRGSGFVILDYEELGAFCNQDCGDKCFRSFLYEEPEETNILG
jgi:hypothetical protein